MNAVTVTAQTCSTLSIRPVTVQLPGCLLTTMAICSLTYVKVSKDDLWVWKVEVTSAGK